MWKPKAENGKSRVANFWQPWFNLQDEMRRLEREVSNKFNRPRRTESRYPAMNLWTGEDEALITVALPGYETESIDLSVLDDTLTLSGKRTPEWGEDVEVHRRERHLGEFSRTISLPFPAEVDAVEATYEAGILTIRVPRAEADKPRKISVQSS